MNSRSKGCRGELEWRDVLRARGYAAERGQQRAGGAESPDVAHDIPGVHFEVKRVEALRFREAVAQAERDCGNRMPVIAHRWNHGEWYVILRARDFFALLERDETDMDISV